VSKTPWRGERGRERKIVNGGDIYGKFSPWHVKNPFCQAAQAGSAFIARVNKHTEMDGMKIIVILWNLREPPRIGDLA
jgi:hypothetical protein